MTAAGQSGAPVQVKIDDQKNGWGWETIAIHVGNDTTDRKNYATLITENMFLDFLLPGIMHLGKLHGQGKKNVDYVKAREKLALQYKE